MARKLKVDFTGVESYTKASEGIHTAKVTDILEKTSQAGDPLLQFTFEVIAGNDKGCRVFDSFALTEKALWKFKAFLQAVGMRAEGRIKLDLDSLVGRICDIEVFWEEYNGQTRAKISDYYRAGRVAPALGEDEDLDDADDEEDEEEDEAPAPEPKKKRGRPAGSTKKEKKPEPEEDEDDEEEEEEVAPPPPPKKSSKKSTTKKSSKKPEPAPIEDDDEDDEWEDDD